MATTQTFIMKQHDLLPKLEVTLLDGETSVDLTTATTARLLMRNSAAGLKVNALMDVSDQSNPANLGKVSYTWQPGDTDTVGRFNAEIEVIWPGGKPQTFPADKYFIIQVQNDLTD